jgi:hypothetical protein
MLQGSDGMPSPTPMHPPEAPEKEQKMTKNTFKSLTKAALIGAAVVTIGSATGALAATQHRHARSEAYGTMQDPPIYNRYYDEAPQFRTRSVPPGFYDHAKGDIADD